MKATSASRRRFQVFGIGFVVVILVWGSLLDRVVLGCRSSSDAVKRTPCRMSSRRVMMLSDG